MQDIVVGNKNFTDVTKPSEIVQLLLNEDQFANLDTTNSVPSQSLNGQPVTTGNNESMRELWNEEGDDFFGHAGNPVSTGASDVMEEDPAAAPAGKKRAKPSNKTRTKPAVPGTKGGRGSKSKQKVAAPSAA